MRRDVSRCLLEGKGRGVCGKVSSYSLAHPSRSPSLPPLLYPFIAPTVEDSRLRWDIEGEDTSVPLVLGYSGVLSGVSSWIGVGDDDI